MGRKYLREKKAHSEAGAMKGKSPGQNDQGWTAETIATAHGTSEKTVRRAAEFASAVDAVDARGRSVCTP